MSSIENGNLAVVQSYLSALESGVSEETLASFFTDDAVQIELPNKLNPGGGQSDLANLLVRAEHGKKLLLEQSYDIKNLVAQGSRVAVEVEWTGVPAISVGSLSAGSKMKAYIAMFFELRDGKIHSQRNYDCFEAW